MAVIDELGSTHTLPWILRLVYVDGNGWEAECPDPAVAILRLEDLLAKRGTKGVREISITFKSGNQFAREVKP